MYTIAYCDSVIIKWGIVYRCYSADFSGWLVMVSPNPSEYVAFFKHGILNCKNILKPFAYLHKKGLKVYNLESGKCVRDYQVQLNNKN